jgi:hypothetical protein
VPLEVGNLGAADEDVLSGLSCYLFLLDLNLYHVRRVLDHLGDVRPVTRTNFTKNALPDPDDAADEPVALQNYLKKHQILY